MSKDKAIKELNERIQHITADKDKQIEDIKASLERQIASLQSNMDIIINAKDELLKAREEALKNKDEVIAAQKQHIKELSKNRDVIQEIGVTPVEDTTTVDKEGVLSSITSRKKYGHRRSSLTHHNHPEANSFFSHKKSIPTPGIAPREIPLLP